MRRPISTFQFPEDVFYESFIFQEQRCKTLPPTSPSCDDVLGHTPCWISGARSQHLIILKISPAKGSFFEKQRRKTTPPTSPLCEDVSGETPPHTMLDRRRPISKAKLSEDVLGESFMIETQRRKTTPPTSPRCEDVSGKTPPQTMLDI